MLELASPKTHPENKVGPFLKTGGYLRWKEVGTFLENAWVPKREIGHSRERLKNSIHIEGPIDGLILGQEYSVQAIANWNDGLRFYIHVHSDSDYPHPFPGEFFEIRDGTIPKHWKVNARSRDGFPLFQVSFSEWASSEFFYERLVEGDPKALAVYKKNRY